MAGSLERIERDVAALEEAIATIGTEFHRTYSNYLQVLGQTARQQLILVCFYICTQAYPESFLALSFSQRERLQAEIRQVADWGLQELHKLGSTSAMSESPVERLDDDGAIEPDIAKVPDADPDPEPESRLSIPSCANEQVTPENAPPIDPERAIVWQEQIERQIAKILQTLSNQTNHKLQKSGILPDLLPLPILEATKTEGFDAVGSAPNLLNFTIETPDPDNADEPHVTQIVAISLRLAEIELTDPSCSAWRTQIRQLSQRLHSLAQQYDRKRKEQAKAQAESAWRTSWFEG